MEELRVITFKSFSDLTGKRGKRGGQEGKREETGKTMTER